MMRPAALMFLLLVGCGRLEPLAVPPGCNPLAHEGDCMLPYPSDFFSVEDASMPRGRGLSFPEPSLPHTDTGEVVDPTRPWASDGYSHLTPIFAVLPGGFDDANLPFHQDDLQASLGDDSPTVLLRADGQRVPHFAEVDPRVADPNRQALFIRPMVRLDDGARYIVALRHLKSAAGDDVVAPEGFRRLRDRDARGDPLLEPISDRYAREVFPVLKSAGVRRKELQLAWDFTTASRERVTGDMLTIRDAVIARFEVTPPPVTVTAVTDDVDANIFRRVAGTLRVPLYMEHASGGALLNRDAEGALAQNGEAEVPFTLLIPRSVAADPGSARVLQFGHGFFGARDEIEGNFVPDFAERTGMVVIAVDWWGMSRADSVIIGGDLLGDLSEVGRFADRVHQGMANQLAVTYAVRTTLADVPEVSLGGQRVYDPAELYYYGISNGHILGGTYLTLSPHIERGVLSVGGAGFNLMMYRAEPFGPLISLIETEIGDRVQQQKLTALLQFELDRFDPITYAPLMFDEPLPGAPAGRRLLMQIGIGDASVPNVASHVHARTLGLAQLTPSPRVVPGLADAAAPHDGSALVEFDFGFPDPLPGTYAEIPVVGNSAHEDVRRNEAGIQQVDALLRPAGRIENFCAGPCDPN